MSDDARSIKSSDSEEGEQTYDPEPEYEDKPRENPIADGKEDVENNSDEDELLYSPSPLQTTTCLHKYAIDRIKGAGEGKFQWPPIMIDIVHYLSSDEYQHERGKLYTERNLVMVELMLKVPIWLLNEVGEVKTELWNDDVIDFSGQSFVEATEIVKDLLRKGKIQEGDVRKAALEHIKQS